MAPSTRPRRLQAALLLILTAFYLVQVAGPLRLHPDTIRLFTGAESALEGHGFLYRGEPIVHPPGYPALLMFLMKLHVARSSVLVLFNVVFIAIGIRASIPLLYPRYFASAAAAWTVGIVTLLSFVFIKYSAFVLTDLLFFAILMGCLVLMERTRERPTWQGFVTCIAMVALAIVVRRVGISLIAPLLWIPNWRRYLTRSSIAGIAVAAVGAFALLIRSTSTLVDFRGVMAVNTWASWILGLLQFRLTEMGELAINLPKAALPEKWHVGLMALGAVVWVVVAIGIARRRKRWTSADVFFVAYAAILFVWPYYDPRFWLPVIPLLVAYVSSVVRPPRVYVLCFGMLGVLSLISSTMVTFSGPTIGDKLPEYRATYCAAGICSGPYNPAEIHPEGLHILQTYR